MEQIRRIEILNSFGRELKEVCSNEELHEFPGFENISNSNPWFTEEFVRFSLIEWSNLLTTENLNSWISGYNVSELGSSKTLGIIMAGNIPAVGMHDFICGFVCGLKLKIKLSSKDDVLMKWIIKRISTKAGLYDNDISIFETRLKDYNAVIATGSNNSNRYFDYYFSQVPKILRGNRNSVAVLSGYETDDDLAQLADDIFMYFGLGCRNVSKLYLPKNYDFARLVKATEKFTHLKNCYKYANNLDYQLAVLSLNRIPFINTGLIYYLENESLHVPVAIVNYEFYTDVSEVFDMLAKKSENLQCIVTKFNNIANTIKFGKTQKPALDEYADNVDTMSFLIGL